MGKTKLLLLLPLVTLGLQGAETPAKPAAAAEAEKTAAPELTAEQKTALAAIDARMVGLEALAAKVDDPDYKADVDASIADLKKRRREMEKNFDQGLYEALMHSVISRYQVVALWLKPPLLAPPAGQTVATPKPPPRKSGPTEKSRDGLGAY